MRRRVDPGQMGKLRPGEVERLAPGHTGRPRPLWNLLLWTLLSCGLGGSAQGPGEWTPWRSWSRCSSSCGRGLSVRSRRCIRFPEEEPCWGDSHEYRLCQLPDCPPGAVPFRDLQCALYNGRPVLGTQEAYRWVPFYGAPNQCDLNCLAEGHAFYHTFGRVLDGTPCSPGTRGLCVAGRCLSAGCDGLLGSDAREDHCGRCGGANDSCLFVQRVFRDAGTFAGYWNVTVIPEGARHIRAAHRSRNHLALMGGDGRYVLNGNWAVSPPGTYEAAGTRVVYTRAAGPEETLHAAGPTSQDLLLQVLLQEPNPGIEFEFWLPRELYGPFQARAQALGWSPRQPQPREVEPQTPESPVAPAAPAAGPPRPLTPAPDPCPPCPDSRGRAHRLLHYCGSDFVLGGPQGPLNPGHPRLAVGAWVGAQDGVAGQPQHRPAHSVPGPSPGPPAPGPGDPLRGACAARLQEPLAAAGPRVRVGAGPLPLPAAGPAPRVPAGRAAPRQPRRHSGPVAAAPCWLCPALEPRRGQPRAPGRPALPCLRAWTRPLPRTARKTHPTGLKLNIFPLSPWLPGSSEISPSRSWVTPCHTHLDTPAHSQIHCHKQAGPGEDTLNRLSYFLSHPGCQETHCYFTLRNFASAFIPLASHSFT
ncbi:ADAMTS-like protein 5 isoform X1 [Equus quagga]|uniref:ADAMTS-like protein 5 isoform X1 n=2 Tax=Equus quagga TaxID=89248 RepID=UPI001EE1E3CF|nr:ADAMTS-like protein 5 isoform X1 [Equus quagga]